MARITIRTIADACGVSPSTVSNAYNRPSQLSVQLRERILATAEELGYAGPSAAGRSLRSGRAGALGVLLADQLSYAFSDPYAIGFLVGVSQVAEAEGVSVLLLSATDPSGHPDIGAVQRANIDGIITLCMDSDHVVLDHAKRRGLPVISTYARSGDFSVAIDDRLAGRLLGEHLHALGHRRIACITGGYAPDGSGVRRVDSLAELSYPERLLGLTEAMPGVEAAVFAADYNSFDAGRLAAAEIAVLDPAATAVVGLSDVLAIGARHELLERGLRVPEDVSVCGFDDIDEAAHHGLTTVAQPILEKGRLAAQMLADPTRRGRVVLDVRLVTRGSTAAPAS
ncbi:LacI family DNA-binding transcriptional regulator [Desertihabitans aurantiacus]|uniref:LacI family DNA-binding transcriptional regulator n=1 Tax=Desertihabitans aurantiacus TaxID=2282477 RepID=UPI000DF7CD36|nr:LacI family DNA-binding transcriptional regulator [Desertihabitans aurantiacus]